ncbi:MAG: N-acetylglucosamine kinase, partial [Cyanobacteriota bacterium]
DALALSLQMADGRRVETPLRQELWQALGLDPADPQAPQRIKALVVNPDFGPAGFAALAPVVEQRAGGGDGDAQAILRTNAAALVAMVVAIADALALEAPAVSPMGGALHHLPRFLQSFAAGLAAALPKSHLSAPEGDACAGAICLARALAASTTAMP